MSQHQALAPPEKPGTPDAKGIRKPPPDRHRAAVSFPVSRTQPQIRIKPISENAALTE